MADEIELYTAPTPNGRKISVMLEEIELPYNVHFIHLGDDEQFEPEYLKLNPNNKIPTIVDPKGPKGEPHVVFESGAILIYLAEKVDSPLWPSDPIDRSVTLQWLMFQMGGVGPMFGQAHHFRKYAPEEVPYAIKRYTNETKRLYGVMDKRLGETRFLAGDDYTIADIATVTWVMRYEWQGVDLDGGEFANVKRWYDEIVARDAVKRGIDVPEKYVSEPTTKYKFDK